MTNLQNELEALRGKISAGIDAYNKALKENKPSAEVIRLEEGLKEDEGKYAKAKAAEVYHTLKGAENPMLAAVEMHDFPVVAHKTVREKGVLKGFALVDDKPFQIDLVKFCEVAEIPDMWKYAVEKFNFELTIGTGDAIGISEKRKSEIKQFFLMNPKAKAVDLGSVSKTQCCKMLQTVVDEILFVKGESGKNIYRVNSHDVEYIKSCYSKHGKGKNSVKTANNNYMHRLIADVLHRIVTGGVYDLECKLDKSADTASEVKVSHIEPQKKVSDKSKKTPKAAKSEGEEKKSA